MSDSLLFYALVAGTAPLLAAVTPFIFFRHGFPAQVIRSMLGVSAGLLFAIATFDLLPAALSSAAQYEDEKHQHDHLGMDATAQELEAHAHEGESHGISVPVLGLGLGYMTLLVLEQVLKTLGHSHSHGHGHAHSSHAGMKKAKSDEDDDHLLDLELSAAASGNGLGGGALCSNSGGGGAGGSGVSLSESHKMKLSESQNNIGRNHSHSIKAAAVSEAFSLIAFVGLGVHSLVDGLLIAAGMEASAQIGTRVALAIILHKFPDGFVMSSVIASSSVSPSSLSSSSSSSSLSSSAVSSSAVSSSSSSSSSASSSSSSSSASSLSRHDPNQTVCGFSYQSCAWMLGIASMTPLGALIGSLLLGLLPASSLGFTMGYGAGTFLFITCSAIVPELFHGAASLRSALTGLLSMAVGYCIFLAIESLSEHHH